MTEVNIEAKALTYFERELKLIEDDSLQAFFYNALAVAPQSFHDDEELQEHVKTAFHILRGSLGQRDVKGAVRDALLGTSLLAYIMFNEFDESMRPLYTVAVRPYLESRKVDKDIHRPLWENVMRAVESASGGNGVSPMLDAKPGTAEFEVLQAFNVARLSYVKLDWEVVYNGSNKGKESEETN